MLIVSIVAYYCLFFVESFNFKAMTRARKHINFFKLLYWWIEIVQFPMIASIMRTGVCHYETDKALRPVQCFHKENWLWVTDSPDMVTVKTIYYSLTFIAWAIALTWNLGLIAHIYSESVSTILHETYLRKKEVEFCLGISANWLTRYFFFFSGYRSGVQRMYFG